MTINIKKNSDEIIFEIVGRLDTTTAPIFEQKLGEVLDGVVALTLDMSGVDYISSAGLRVLLGAQKKMQKQGKMKLTGVCEEVMEILEMTGFADILAIE